MILNVTLFSLFCFTESLTDLNHSTGAGHKKFVQKMSNADDFSNGNEASILSSPATVTNLSNNSTAINASLLLIQSESTDTNTSQEEVDPKSQLANKTIFKNDNPNLSIIEINENSIKEEDLEKKIVLIERLSDDENDEAVEKVKNILRKSPNKAADNGGAAAADKRRRKTESLLQSSKQKLDISIAEASAAAEGGSNNEQRLQVMESTDRPQTKREITIYDSLEEFDKHLPPTVTLLETPFGSKVYLVGTAHFSEESQDDVSYVSSNKLKKYLPFNTNEPPSFRSYAMSVQMWSWLSYVHHVYTY